MLAVLALLGCFLSPESGERIGFCVTLLLAREFGKSIVAEHTPICSEDLWIQYFDVYHEVSPSPSPNVTTTLTLTVNPLDLSPSDPHPHF